MGEGEATTKDGEEGPDHRGSQHSTTMRPRALRATHKAPNQEGLCPVGHNVRRTAAHRQ